MKSNILIAAFLLMLTLCAQGQTKDTAIEKFAKFPQGAEQFYEYIKREVKYPIDARQDSLTGHVYVEFIIGATGAILPESVKVVQGLSSSCDAEAVRVIKAAPNWTPARTKTEAIEQTITFPVSFVFNKLSSQ